MYDYTIYQCMAPYMRPAEADASGSRLMARPSSSCLHYVPLPGLEKEKGRQTRRGNVEEKVMLKWNIREWEEQSLANHQVMGKAFGMPLSV